MGGYWVGEKTVLNYLLNAKYPKVMWKSSKNAMKEYRKEKVDEIATDLATSAVEAVLKLHMHSEKDRIRSYKTTLEQKIAQTGGVWYPFKQT